MPNPMFTRSIGVTEPCRLCVLNRLVLDSDSGVPIWKEAIEIPSGDLMDRFDVCPVCDQHPEDAPLVRERKRVEE